MLTAVIAIIPFFLWNLSIKNSHPEFENDILLLGYTIFYFVVRCPDFPKPFLTFRKCAIASFLNPFLRRRDMWIVHGEKTVFS